MNVGPRRLIGCIAVLIASTAFHHVRAATQIPLPKMVFVRQGSLWIWEQPGREKRLTQGFQDANPTVSPDGKTVVFERRVPSRHDGILGKLSSQLWLLRLDSGDSHRLLRAPGDCLTPSFDPKGKVVYFDHVWDYKPRNHQLAHWRESIGVVDVASKRWRDLAPLTRQVVEYQERQYAFPVAGPCGGSIIWSPVPHEGGVAYIYAAGTDGTGRRVISGPRRRRSEADHSYYFASPSRAATDLVCLRGGEEYGAITSIDCAGREIWRTTIPGLVEYSHPPAAAQTGVIAFEHSDNNRKEIWVLDPGDKTNRKIVADASQPAWVPRS